MNVKIVFEHYRFNEYAWSLDQYRRPPRKGKPDGGYLWRYRRNGKGMALGYAGERGGETTCEILDDGKFLSIGIATCSMSDNFCYKTGRDLALKRALEKLPEELRKEVLHEPQI